MKSSVIYSAIIAASCILSSAVSAKNDPQSLNHDDRPIDQVFDSFREPAAHARPFVRWWWNNNQVEETRLLHELDVMEKAGIGGVEINPIKGKNDPSESKSKVLTWRSPEWDDVLLAACKGAKERGMVVDLIAGSGWPFGGKFLEPDQQIQRIFVNNKSFEGGQTISLSVDDYLQVPDYMNKDHPELAFVKYWRKPLSSIDQVINTTAEVDDDGTVDIKLDEGEYVVAVGWVITGFCEVTFGVPGADGPTMDHMQKSVTRMYLDRLKGVEKSWGEPLSEYVRAIFCDSIETMGANWTKDMTSSFQDSKGYDITPWLPLVVETDNADASEEMHDKILRARYDWNDHIVSVFLHNFTQEYTEFCHDHGLLSRYQAYGLPELMGMAEGYMIPDIPESNNWLYSLNVIDPMDPPYFTWNQYHGYMIWNKYASAGGRLRGKKIISSEAMTNTKRVFHLTLASIKQADDMNFITGITHSVLHGYNYSPADIPFPGWIRFGAYFSEYNSWWPYFSRWVDYNARLSSVFQETRPVAEVAILGKRADHWSATGLSRDPIHLEPDYLHRLWEPLSQLGVGNDYLHEDVIQGAKTNDGLLRIGPMDYNMLIVADAISIEPETAEAILDFVQNGGKVLFVGSLPTRAPGLVQSKESDNRVQSAVLAAINAGANFLSAPAKGADGYALKTWMDDALDHVSYPRALDIQSPTVGLYSLRHRAPDAELMFFTNTHRHEPVESRVDFALGESGLWHWNPETGERSPYDLPSNATGFDIDLGPLESVLLVTGPKREPAPKAAQADPLVIATPWELTFHPIRGKEPFGLTTNKLADFTASDDPRIRKFAGTAVYKTSFTIDETPFTRLDLGGVNDFISEVELNGHKLGVSWYGTAVFDLRGALRKGENQLTVRYTTTLWNAMGKEQLQPSGLLGPVMLR